MLAMWLATVLVLSERSFAISLVAVAAGELGEDLELSLGKGSADRGRGAAARLDGEVQLADALQELSGDLRGEHGFPGGGGFDGADDRLGGRGLEDVAAGAGDDRFDDAVLF